MFTLLDYGIASGHISVSGRVSDRPPRKTESILVRTGRHGFRTIVASRQMVTAASDRASCAGSRDRAVDDGAGRRWNDSCFYSCAPRKSGSPSLPRGINALGGEHAERKQAIHHAGRPCACPDLAPGTVLAQSSVAGQVTDETGGVLPGVAVEAASAALIEGSRTAFTDGQGCIRSSTCGRASIPSRSRCRGSIRCSGRR